MKTFALAIILLLASSVKAGPVSWAKHQLRDHPLRTQLVFAGISAGVYAEGLHRCRIPNVENCQEHYGAAWGGYGATVGLDLAGVLIGHKIGGKAGNAIAYGGDAAVLGWGLYQWGGGLNKPARDEKPDLSSTILVR